ncbi:hypothetical protein IAR50_002585 [Cryptococcus sp. DSM 104548]
MPPRRRTSTKAQYTTQLDFSDDDDSDSGDAPGPSTRPKAKARGRRADSDESMTSGDGSAFEPDSDGSGVKRESGSESEVEEEEEEGEEDEGGSGDEFDRDPSEMPLRSIGDTLHSTPIPKGRGKKRPRESTAAGRKIKSGANSGQGIFTPQPLGEPSNTEILAGVPAVYIKEILGMSDRLAGKYRDEDPGKTGSKPKGNYSKLGGAPFPHPIPYSTFLADDPRFGSLPNPRVTRIVNDKEKGTQKQQRAKLNKDASRLALGVPWEMWRGDAWWAEMYVGEQGGGDGNPGEWLDFGDVKMGLENVGRVKKEELVFLNHGQAAPYLPSPEQPSIAIHVGPRTAQSVITMKPFDVLPIVETNPIVPQPAYTFYAGGPVTSIDWCPIPASKAAHDENTQWLAVATLPNIDASPRMYDRAAQETKGSIQIWSLTPPSYHTPANPSHDAPKEQRGEDVVMQGDNNEREEGEGQGSKGQGSKGQMDGGMTCEVVLCLRGGSALDIKWMPIGAWDDYDPETLGKDGEELPKLGILGAVQIDGSISFYAVPHPRAFASKPPNEPLYLDSGKPLCKIQLEDAMFTCFDWLSGSTVGAGLDNGSVAVYDIHPLLSSPSPSPSPPLPILYTSISSSALSSLSASRLPPHQTRLGEDTTMMSIGGWDGTFVLLDVRDGGVPMLVRRQNLPIMCTGWSNFLPGPMMGNLDYNVEITTLGTKSRLMNKGRGTVLGGHKGTVMSLSASVFHPMVMSGSADGTLMMTNQFDALRRVDTGGRRMESHTIYALEYAPALGAYRITDDFLPASTLLASLTAKTPENELAAKHPMWDARVGVSAVRWNCAGGLGQAGWCASGTCAGVGRVDWVAGRFHD